jgi:hypothetical protein
MNKPEEVPAMQFTQCPEPACGAPAEIVDRFVLRSTDGAVEHVKVLCLHGHWFMLPAFLLAAAGGPEAGGKAASEPAPLTRPRP